MDTFRSAVFVRDILLYTHPPKPIYSLSHDLFGNDGDPVPEDYLVIDTQAWGWWDGGLHKLLKLQQARPVAPREALFFRGAALFGNFDDAKNDYLMNPEMVTMVRRVELGGSMADDFDEEIEQHTPFGMVIPQWRSKTHEERRGGEQHEGGDPVLVSVTIILFWKPLP